MSAPNPASLRAALWRFSAESVIILLATAVVAAFVLQAAPLQSANDRSRWATVWSLVERHTFQIDEIDSFGRWSTIDKVRYRTSETEPWHFYSSKPPLLSVMVAGLYAIERSTLGYGLFNDTALVTRLLLLIVNVLPFYFALRSLSKTLQMMEAAIEIRAFILAVAGFGSILNPYLTTLNNHTPAVACAMFSITAAVSLLKRRSPGENDRGQTRDFVSLGFFSALTCCFELPAAQMGVLAFVAALFINRGRTVTCFLPAALIPLMAFFATNWMATGGVKPFYATYGSETYVYEHNGIPSYWTTPRDLDANTESPAVYLFHCVLGHHGLLSLTPVFIITLIGWWFTLRGGQDQARRTLILSGLLMSLVTLGFYLTRTQNYNYGGNSVGLRWMLWLSPFWWIAMVPALERCTRRAVQSFALSLLVISTISTGWSMNRPWRPSWLFEQMEAAGWINYKTPISPFESPRYSVFAAWPDNIGDASVWRNTSGERLIVTAREHDSADSPPNNNTQNPKNLVRHYELESNGEKQTLLESDGRLRQIVGIEMLLNRPALKRSDSQSQVSQQAALLDPRWSGFRPAGPTWIPSRSNPAKAWKVERAAARMLIDDPVFGKCWHRCDVLYCDQLPFGVLQWKTAVTQDSTGDVLSTETWVAEDH